jgi:endonuclease/exonuclease/phosphatase family metal-dependent hydrolase
MPGSTLTVLSWNLFLGTGAPRNLFEHFTKHKHVFFTDRGPRRSLAPVSEALVGLGCDVACLQEVDAGSLRNGGRNLIDEIADLAGFRHRYFARQRGLHCNDGIALVSRFAPASVSTTVLVHDFEQRGLIAAEIEIGGRVVTIAVTHLSAFPFNGSLRRRQCEQIARELADRKHVVLGADFNCDPESPDLAPLREAGLRALVAEPSFPAYEPRYRFDNVFVSKEVTTVEARVVGARCSDHLAVLAKLVV